eukprot:TRINITY_DN9157_c0_g2_i1.p1 TRINITY_DN9157_c0_g2~~TRINITY_DN9157_c0_g2_i1.p1  ORF type:complete len:205 (+),score=23.79 TRINITY_DN9157_c0_g2_i1:69-683(+)
MGQQQACLLQPQDLDVGDPVSPNDATEVSVKHSVIDNTSGSQVYRVRLKYQSCDWIVSKRFREFTTLWECLSTRHEGLKKIVWWKKSLGRVVVERAAFCEQFSHLCVNFQKLVNDFDVKTFFCLPIHNASILRVNFRSHLNLFFEKGVGRIFIFIFYKGNTIYEYATDDTQSEWKDEGFCVYVNIQSRVQFFFQTHSGQGPSID